MTASESPFVAWRKSSKSADNGACLEVAHTGDAVGVRDSKDPVGPVLIFDQATWLAFVSDVKSDGFRRP